MIFPLLVAFSFESPLNIEVKDGCSNESAVLLGPITLYSDERACAEVHPRLFFTNWTTGSSYWAWGECGNGAIRYGFGKDKDECMGSMSGDDGAHRTIMPSAEVSEDTCVCHDRYGFREALYVSPVITAEVYDSSVAYRCVKEIIKVQESQDEEPIPHTDDSNYYLGWVIVFPILILLLVLPLMLWSN